MVALHRVLTCNIFLSDVLTAVSAHETNVAKVN